MRIFVTGASGFIGSAVVPELIAAGHQVVGLARSDASAKALIAAGAEVHRGTLQDLESLRAGAAAADGVIHLAYIHDSTDYATIGQTDVRAIEAMGDALEGTGKPLVITSATIFVALNVPSPLTTENTAADPASTAPRIASENAAARLAARGVRTSIVRLAPSVHGEGDPAFVPYLIELARRTGVSGYLGDGSNRWPAVHRLDAARLFRIAVESAPAGSTLHGIAEEGVPFREIAEVIGRQLNVPVSAIPAQDAAEHFGFIAALVPADAPASSALTQERFGWRPVQPELIPDLEAGHYVKN
jgi:nucleoside-diphosphate-sugar epimerase